MFLFKIFKENNQIIEWIFTSPPTHMLLENRDILYVIHSFMPPSAPKLVKVSKLVKEH